MTNDGDIVNKIFVLETITKRIYGNGQQNYRSFYRKMSNGVPILDTVTRNVR
jgi:hypothetical protein